MNQISKIVDNSTLTDVSSASESDRKLTSGSSVDLEFVGDSDDESDLYSASDVNKNSLHIVRTMGVGFPNNNWIQNKTLD